MEPAVSVVLPTHDRAGLLGRAVESVLRQTFGDLELIVVDDGSTDGTGSVAWAWAERDPRVRVHRHATALGAAAARNAGIELARGRYVAFLDDDDEWLPGKLAAQLRALDAAPDAGLVYCPYQFVALTGGVRVLGTFDPAAGVAAREMIFRRNFVATPTAMVRRDLLREVGGFDVRLPQVEDWDLWIRLALVTGFAFVAAPLVRVHETPDSVSSRTEPLVRAGELLLAKLDATDLARRERANFIYSLGHEFVGKGVTGAGQRLILRSLAMRPWPPQRFGVVLAVLLGSRAYAAARWLRFVTLELAWRWRHGAAVDALAAGGLGTGGIDEHALRSERER